MPVADQQLSALRAQIAGDEQRFCRARTQLADADMQSYELLLQTVLSLAAGRRFASGYSASDVIQYAARVRAGTGERDEDMALDPRSAEATLRYALGQTVEYVKDPYTRLRCALALLTTLLIDLDLHDDEVDALLSDATSLANRWLAE